MSLEYVELIVRGMVPHKLGNNLKNYSVKLIRCIVYELGLRTEDANSLKFICGALNRSTLSLGEPMSLTR